LASRSSARSSTSCPLVEAASCLSWSKTAGERLHARARDLRIVLERAGEVRGFIADLTLEIVDLRLQFLDARMIVEQRG